MSPAQRVVQHGKACDVSIWLQIDPRDDTAMAWCITGAGWPLQTFRVTEYDWRLDPLRILVGMSSVARACSHWGWQWGRADGMIRAPLHDDPVWPEDPQLIAVFDLPLPEPVMPTGVITAVDRERGTVRVSAIPVMHQGENRRRRRAEVAKFQPPEELKKTEPKLRRKLLKQRQVRALGTMDVELNRLRRRKAKTK